jgi:hypothetical protein
MKTVIATVSDDTTHTLKPLESALTKFAPASPMKSTLAHHYQNAWLTTPLQSALASHKSLNSTRINTYAKSDFSLVLCGVRRCSYDRTPCGFLLGSVSLFS